MREIKFRAWNAVEQKMHHVTRLSWEYPIGLEINGSIITGFIESLMQYIGYADRNGTDIYEADILKDLFDRILLVEWRRDRWCFKALSETNFRYACTINQWFEGDTAAVTIIGNRFETPELMESVVMLPPIKDGE